MLCGALSPSMIEQAEAGAAAERAALEAPPAPKPRMAARERTIMLTAVLVVVSFVVGYGITHAAKRTGSTAASQLQAHELDGGATTTTITPLQALESSIVPPSHDFIDYSMPDFPVGALTIDDIPDRDERDLLTTFHMARGEAKAWERISSGDVILKIALEFPTEDDAKNFFGRDTDGYTILGGSSVPGALTTQALSYGGITMEQVEFRKAARVYVIYLGSLSNRFTAASPAALADEQYRAA